MRALAAAPALSPDQAMDWAEKRYPDLFPTAGKTAGTYQQYTYRYYPQANNYLGISTGTPDDVAVYLFGNVEPGQSEPVRLAPLAAYTCTVIPQNCAPDPLSPNIATWGDSLTPPFAANLKYLYQLAGDPRQFFDGGVPAQDSTMVADREVAAMDKHSWVTVLWSGQNNDDAPEQIKADIARSISALSTGNTRFVVLGIINKARPEEMKGTVAYDRILQLNRDLAALYPDNFIDIRAQLASLYDPSNPQDVIDHANDVIPSSLRHDEDHLNNDGSVAVAVRVRAFIEARSW